MAESIKKRVATAAVLIVALLIVVLWLPAQATVIALTVVVLAGAWEWSAFLKRTEISLAPDPFPAVQVQIAALVMPPTLALNKGDAFEAHWPPGGPWAA